MRRLFKAVHPRLTDLVIATLSVELMFGVWMFTIAPMGSASMIDSMVYMLVAALTLAYTCARTGYYEIQRAHSHSW